MPKITDANYKQFLTTGMITLLDRAAFEELLAKVRYKEQAQAVALCILLYYTGRRPIEVLNLTRKDINKEKRAIKILFKTAKKGWPTTLFLPLTPHMAKVWEYVGGLYPQQYLFWSFRSKGVHTVKWHSKKGEAKAKTYEIIGGNLRYWVKKWFGCTPYFLRHNRFSDMADKGASDFEIMYAKGARTLASVLPYRHLSKAKAEKMAKYFK